MHIVPQICVIGGISMKKLLSCGLACLLSAQSLYCVVFAAEAGRISVGSATVGAGESFELPVVIEENPGIAAMSLNLTYDASKLELLGAADGQILGTSTFLACNDLTMIPYTMNWDDLSTENNTGTGMVAVLSFRARDGVVGETEVAVAVNQKSTFNVDLDEVPFETVSGTVSIMPDETAAVVVDTISANTGDTVEVPIRLQNNPGITALSLNISYDNTQLKLLGAADGKILGTSTFLSGNDLTLIPYTLNWDDLSTENNTGNGIVATLSFEVLADAGTAEITVAVNQKSTFNVDLEEVAFDAVNGAVQIGGTVTSTEGDYNGDGTVSIADAVMLAQFVDEDGTLTDDQITGILNTDPDYDSDGLVTIFDVTALLRTLEA